MYSHGQCRPVLAVMGLGGSFVASTINKNNQKTSRGHCIATGSRSLVNYGFIQMENSMFIWLVVAIGSTVFLFTYHHRLLVD
ncbi:MAG: hypothetical protein CMJ20_07490 [Phycisphaeraceae bacterium]|nr:hypothetical protein [Phycisphaeraceae bacterium]